MEPETILANINLLPPETLELILLQVKGLKDLTSLCQANSKIQAICDTNTFWIRKLRQDYPHYQIVQDLPAKEQYQLAMSGPIISPISVGKRHYGIIDDQGHLFMGGSGTFGVWGTGTTVNSNLSDFSGISPFQQKVKSVCSGDMYSAAITEDGKVYAWGEYIKMDFQPTSKSVPTQLAIPGKAIKVVCSNIAVDNTLITTEIPSGFILALIMEDLSVLLRMVVKPKNLGQTGDQNFLISTTINLKARDISIGKENLAIVTTDGKLYYLGASLDITEARYIGMDLVDNNIVIDPIQIPLPEPIKQVSLSDEHIGVVSISRNAYLWGRNEIGQLGLPGWSLNYVQQFGSFVEEPQQLKLPGKVADLRVHKGVSLAITTDGKLYMWGSDQGGRIGLANKPVKKQLIRNNWVAWTPVQIKPFGDLLVSYADVTDRFSLAVTQDGVVNLWGGGRY